MRDLDNRRTYEELDPTFMRHRLAGFPDQCKKAWEEVSAFRLPSDYRRVERVVVLGMGGSAIGGDLLADLASLESSPPVLVSRDYGLPPYVDQRTLVIACSYSGNTAETLSSFRQALSRGARVVAVTSGGTLAGEARGKGVPAFILRYQGEPRSALGYLFLSPVGILQRLGLLEDKSRDVAEAVERLEALRSQWAEDVPHEKNSAKELARDLAGRVVVVYGAGAFGAVAHRWKTQLNENSKVWAFWEMLPEAHHNSVVGYGLPEGIARMGAVVLIRPPGLHPQLEQRFDLTCELLEREGVPCNVVELEGPNPLCRMLTGTYFGDYVSYYLAVLQGVDPSPVPPIDFIKSRLS